MYQLRRTYATDLVNAGVSLQAPHEAAWSRLLPKMSLRCGQLFDSTVRTEYERALDLAKARIGPMNTGPLNRPHNAAAGGHHEWRWAGNTRGSKPVGWRLLPSSTCPKRLIPTPIYVSTAPATATTTLTHPFSLPNAVMWKVQLITGHARIHGC
jgi:hypothetical protein